MFKIIMQQLKGLLERHQAENTAIILTLILMVVNRIMDWKSDVK